MSNYYEKIINEIVKTEKNVKYNKTPKIDKLYFVFQ